MALPKGVGRIGPYRVERQLGAGGMGEVYKAFDDRLERWVAIKRIRPDKEQAGDHRTRFRREARAAAKLNHSSIVHVYDIFQDGDSDCIVMELVEGRSLDVVLQDGPVTPIRATVIGRQIAAGLAEAHRKGILHRDLKTENIIVTDEDEAKILDFGLAKPMVQGDLDASLTGQGQVVGTSRAMSPEYVGGDDVDHRADLFSLGVLLYETVTGQSPFRAHNTLATLKRVILHQQAPACEINPTVPEGLSMLIDGLLEKEPKDRISTAQEVVDRLDEAIFVYGSGSGERPPLSSSRVTQELDRPDIKRGSRGKRRLAWIAAAVALLIIATVAGTIWFRRDPTTQEQLAFEEQDTIVIGDFINRTGEAVFDEGLDLVFRVGIEQGRFAKVLSEPQMNEALQRMELEPDTPIDQERGIEIAQREGAKAFVVGTIVKVGTAYSLTGEIIDPESGQTVFSESRSEGDQGKILSALGEVIESIRSNLGESIGETHSESLELAKVTTSDLDALEAYSLGIARLSHGQYDEAVVFFSRAIELDPQFAMAHAKLGTAHRNASRDLAQATHHYQQALQFSDRLSTSEELYVKGWIATWLGTPAEMIDAWTLMTELVPGSFEAKHNLGMVYWNHLNRFDDAAEWLWLASEISGIDVRLRLFALDHMGFCQLASGKLDSATESFSKTRDTVSPIGFTLAQIAQGKAVDLSGDPDQESITNKPASQLDQIFVKEVLHLRQGEFDDALKLSLASIDEARRDTQPHWEATFRLLALNLLLRQGDSLAFEHLFMKSIPGTDTYFPAGPSDLDPSRIPLLASLGKLAIRANRIDLARPLLRQIEQNQGSQEIPVWTAYENMLAGELLAAQGELSQATDLLEQGLEILDSFQLHESLGWIAELRTDSAAALREYRWLDLQFGRVLVECREICFDRLTNVLNQVTAKKRIAQLSEG